jgi:molecular chaperone DnaK
MGSQAIGIDLGTTNCVAATIEGLRPTVIINSDGSRTTPSIVAYTNEKKILVGPIAKRQNVLNPKNTFFTIKRFIGSKIYEFEPELLDMPYKITYDVNSNILLECPALNTKFRPEEISAEILRLVISETSEFIRDTVKQIVLTVPAYFNDSQRQATHDAGEIAGVEVLRIINEPTAAALAHGFDGHKHARIIVFDMGGGTFDVSLLDIGDGVFEVVATAGNSRLGGLDFDQRLNEFMIEYFEVKNPEIDLDMNIKALQRIVEVAEGAKIDLSGQPKTRVYVPFIGGDSYGSKHIYFILTLGYFEKLCKSLWDKCLSIFSKAVHEVKFKKYKFDRILLVGGATRMSAIVRMVSRFLPVQECYKLINPDEIVAVGAAIQANILVGDVPEVLLIDVTPLTLGVEVLDEIFVPLIKRNSSVPAIVTESFSTADDNQENVEIRIFQGEHELSEYNRSLGLFILNGIDPAPMGEPEIQVTFDLDVDGILSVRACDQQTGKQKSISISGSSNLSRAEVKKLIRKASYPKPINRLTRKNKGIILIIKKCFFVMTNAPQVYQFVPNKFRFTLNVIGSKIEYLEQVGHDCLYNNNKYSYDALLKLNGNLNEIRGHHLYDRLPYFV